MAIDIEKQSFERGVGTYVSNPGDRALALYRLRRSVAVGKSLAGALQAGEEISKHAGVRRIAVVCMDPRNVTGLIKDLGVRVMKYGGAVAATRDIELDLQIPTPSGIHPQRTSSGGKIVRIPDSDFFAGTLQSLAMSSVNGTETLLVASGHFGEIPCGFMHGLEEKAKELGKQDPYKGDTVRHNSVLIEQGTIEPATNIFNMQHDFQNTAAVRRLGVKLPWNTDKATFVLDYHHDDPKRTLTVADLVIRHAKFFEERFGAIGQYRTEIKSLKNNSSFWSTRTRMVKEISDGTHFRAFQEDLEKWRDSSLECDGLTDNQFFGLVTQIADNAAMDYLLDTPRRGLSLLADFLPHQIFLSLNGITLDEKDPVASRLSSSPLNGENIGDTLIEMTDLSFDKAGMVQELIHLRRGHHRLYQLPERRTAFISFAINPDVDDPVTALLSLGKAMRAIRGNPHTQEYIDQGRLSVVPVIIDSRTSAAVSIPIFPDFINSRL